MNCRDCSKKIEQWESGDTLEVNGFAELENHIAGCRSCGPRYTLILEFIRRDAGEIREILPFTTENTSILKEKILAKIPGKYPVKKAVPIRFILAAALVLIIIGAFLFLKPVWLPAEKNIVTVNFELSVPEAESVILVGDFTGWDSSKLRMKDPDEDGIWEITIKLKKRRTYTYNFLIDGQKWVADPASDLMVDDGFGGISSVISL